MNTLTLALSAAYCLQGRWLEAQKEAALLPWAGMPYFDNTSFEKGHFHSSATGLGCFKTNFDNHFIFSLKPTKPSQDARKNILALRYSACSKSTLKQEGGVLGLINLAESQDFTAVGVKKGCLGVIKDLCLGKMEVPGSVFWPTWQRVILL